MGAGEFEAWHDEVDRWLLERASPGGSVLVVPAASAPEGEDVFRDWAARGCAHYERLGLPVQVAPIQRRQDADAPEAISMLEDASMVFFSGGNPYALAECLRGSAFWQRLTERLGDGLAFAGCSAGVAFLTDVTYDTAVNLLSEDVWKPGLGYLPNVLFGPHFDTVEQWYPGAHEFITGSLREGEDFVGIDESTAMLGDGATWEVRGRGRVHLLRSGVWSEYAAGETFELQLEG
jgi:cyanophycinase-like exopeptidase